MKKYKTLNNWMGWLTFIIAAITYLLTIEPTASFWDCGEFITTSTRLEVGHPPGAPFFMIMGRFFSLFAIDSAHIAMMINIMSALASGFTILFLFWTITHLGKNLINSENPSKGQIITILGSGMVGALAFTFSDTFWFSAVEGEVYATSSLITAMVFWAILKWEDVADEPYANRWIILIAYLVGLSIGVHLLNLLAIPAIVFVYYFRKYKTTRKGVIASLLVSVILLALIMYGIIPGVVTIASWFELLFTNVIGLPFNTGVVIYAILLIGLIIYGIYYTYKKKIALWNTVLVAFTVIMIGYSSFAMVVIRSSADPPMDQNNPDNVFSLLSYLNREQYGSRPLFSGQYYNTPRDNNQPYKKDKPYYIMKDGKYVIADVTEKPNYDSRYTTFFPRMWSNNTAHINAYKSWANIKGRPVTYTDERGQKKTINLPTFGENLTFFLRYQVGFMYLRYFMWNFVGRQNDNQGEGGILNGNWLSGINFIDSARLGNQKTLPDSIKNNKARNTYFFLPLILGLIGAFFHYKKDQKNFWVVMLLFIMTGLAIVVYLNQTPNQPRERDYAYVGSFYAFAIWIGIGVLSIVNELKKHIPEVTSAVVVTLVCLIFVPGVMAHENWNDHDRSNRYTCRDFGANYLNTCTPNSVIFTNGDNDTFPLWYDEDVEGIRTDVRVCNLSYLQTDWYIDQMKRKAWKSDPLPISFTSDQYVQGNRDVVYLMNDSRIKGPIELSKALDFVKSDDPRTKLQSSDNAAYLPVKKFFVKVDKEAVIKNKVVPESEYDQIVDTIFIDLSDKGYLIKDDLMMLDMIANNKWDRGIYFAITVGQSQYLNLQDYFQLEGFAYRFTPVKTKSGDMQIGRVYTDKMYKNMMENFKWGNMNDPDVYIDENNRRMMINIRNNFDRLAKGLIAEGKKDSAVMVLDKCEELIPSSVVPYNYFSQKIAEDYYAAGAKDKGSLMVTDMYNCFKDQLNYYFSLDLRKMMSVNNDIERSFFLMREIGVLTKKYGDEDLYKEIDNTFNKYAKMYYSSAK